MFGHLLSFTRVCFGKKFTAPLSIGSTNVNLYFRRVNFLSDLKRDSIFLGESIDISRVGSSGGQMVDVGHENNKFRPEMDGRITVGFPGPDDSPKRDRKNNSLFASS